MKTVIKILISIIISILLFFIIDYIFYKYMLYNQTYFLNSNKDKIGIQNEQIKLSNYFIKLNSFKEIYDIEKSQFRPVMNENSNENSIIIFGCSYAYGYIFENEKTLSYIMSKYSKRPIYNRSMNGWGIQHMLYQLKEDKNMYNEITKPKYVFYVLMNDSSHFLRLFHSSFPDIFDSQFYLTYKSYKGDLKEKKPLFNIYIDFMLTKHLYNSFIRNKIDYDFYINPDENEKLFDFFVLHFKVANNLIKKNWGNETKFIILTFENTQKQYWENKLKKLEIDVIDIAEIIEDNNLTDFKKGYFEPEIYGHPNEKLWEKLVPKLKKIYPDL